MSPELVRIVAGVLFVLIVAIIVVRRKRLASQRRQAA